MALLKDINIKKVSLVRNPANKRKFLFWKSRDKKNEPIKKKKEDKKMPETLRGNVVQLAEGVLRKYAEENSAADKKVAADEVVKGVNSLLGDDKDKHLNKEETTLVKSLVSYHNSFVKKEDKKTNKKVKDPKNRDPENKKTNKSEEAKAIENLTAELKKSNERSDKLEEMIAKRDEARELRKTKRWLEENAQYAVEDFDKTAKEIVTLAKSSEEAAETMKNSLKRSSKLVEKNSDSPLDPRGTGKEGDLTKTAKLDKVVAKANEDTNEKNSQLSLINKGMQSSEAKDAYREHRMQHDRRNNVYVDRNFAVR